MQILVKYLASALLIFFVFNIAAQTFPSGSNYLIINYDNAGNRILRKYQIDPFFSKIGDRVNTDSLLLEKKTERNMSNDLMSNYSIYPNPSNNFFFIKSNNFSDKTYSFKIYSSEAKILHQEANIRVENIRIDVSEYNSGYYFIEIKSDAEHLVWKVIKY